MHFSDNELTILSIIDLLIVYLFCILQISYNVLTAIYIKKAINKINRLELWRAYLFAMAPIVYSILPILLILYLYIPSNMDYDPRFPGFDFSIKLIYLHLPPIIIVFIIIITWNIMCSIHNHQFKDFKHLFKQQASNELNIITQWDTNTKVVFRKAIYKWLNKMIKLIDEATNNNDLYSLHQILKKVEGWYVAKKRFQFFWCTKKKYHWIKQYYFNHYITLIYHIQKAYNKIKK